MARHGKNFKQAVEKVESHPYSLSEAVGLAKESAFAKFDETMEMAMRLGVDPRHADQMVRGTVVAQARNFSSGGALPVMSRSSTPSARMARHL